jgi:hypothetical protein
MSILYLLAGALYIQGAAANHTTPGDKKILTVVINENGAVSVGRDTLSADNLARYIQERLFKSYLGTGKMQDAITLKKNSDAIPDMVTDVIIQEIKEGQKKALTEICLQKYRKGFDSIDERKQDKLKKQFPVLFQQEFL